MSLFDTAENLIFRKGKKTATQQAEDSATVNLEKTTKGIVSIKDIIAPSAIEIDFNFLRVGNVFFRTLFMSGYPRYVGANWLAPLVNFP